MESFTFYATDFTLIGMASNPPYRPIHFARWRRFRDLLGPAKGAASDAARLLEKTPGQISHIAGRNPVRIIGDQIADEIEKAYGKPLGWLDGLTDSALPTNGTVPPKPVSRTVNATSVEEAWKWLNFEETRNGPFQPLRRAERLIALYLQIEADGGSLSPQSAEAIIRGETNGAASQPDTGTATG